MNTNTIEGVSALLTEQGFARAKNILAYEIRVAREDAASTYAVLGETHYAACGLGRRELNDARRREYAAGYARHALFVLAGHYDDAVRAGRSTLTVDGVQPEIVEQAHALRRSEI